MNLGAFGDAGDLVTSDPELAERVRALREHGQTRKYEHEVEGYTARLDTLQALVLLRKLPLLDEWNAQRRQAAARYDAALSGLAEITVPAVAPRSEPVWHLYVVRTSRASDLAEFLRQRGIATGRHYPTPPHLCRAYRHLGYVRGTFPITERLAAEGLSLPIYPGIREAQIEAVAETIAEFFAT